MPANAAQKKENRNIENETEDKIKTNENKGPQRVITNPSDVVGLVMMQIDAVNSKKDELTIAMKNLSDTTKQLVRAYGEHTKTIAELKKKLAKREG